ncbi:hypothetical protein Hanom_Chr06g00497711 [Helianthus anomalus]
MVLLCTQEWAEPIDGLPLVSVTSNTAQMGLCDSVHAKHTHSHNISCIHSINRVSRKHIPLHKIGPKYELSHYPQLKRNFVSKFGTHSLRKQGKLYRSLVFLGCHILPPLIWNFVLKFRSSSFSLSSGCIGSE